jgi:L-aspartate oxidase
MERIETDFVVIGSGVAGLRAAIELASAGNVVVVTKDVLRESSTEYAQGGVAAALSDEDEVGIHYSDTIRAGDGLCREDAVRVLVEEGPERILELIQWGAEFDKRGTKLDFTLEAAHSRRRVLHAHGDSTGREIERVLINKVSNMKNISRLPFAMGVDLIVVDGRCIGTVVIKEDHAVTIFSRATLLATGGAGQIFIRTTNPAVTTGDGMAMALRAGARLENMEFVQFHPTALFIPGAPNFLLSEAMRGEGGILRNIMGDSFMKNYHSDGELAPRDVVSRAIISEMVKTKSSHVYLDLTHLDSQFIKNRFPRIYTTCLNYGIDITKEMIPVSPAAHYIMGGVKTDIYGRTTLPGLYAAGEVASTGVHGANRLASNSLLEGLVYGKRAGETAREERAANFSGLSWNSEIKFRELEKADEYHNLIRRVMWERAGIIRCKESLSIAKRELEGLRHVVMYYYKERKALEVKNMLQCSMAIVESALERQCSVGAHYRSDYPDKRGCFYNTIAWLEAEGMISIEKESLEQ